MGKRKYIKGTPEERFVARVVKSADPGGCWEYDGFRWRGYGKFGISPSESVLAHHFAYRLWVGKIPEGHHLHHKCENPACVRPDHLEPKLPGAHRRDHARDKGVVTNQYGQWSVTQSDEEKRIRDRDWMREFRARRSAEGHVDDPGIRLKGRAHGKDFDALARFGKAGRNYSCDICETPITRGDQHWNVNALPRRRLCEACGSFLRGGDAK